MRKQTKYISIVTFFLGWVSTYIFSQYLPNIPALVPAQEQAITQATGLSRVCTADVFIDSKGQLWVNTCAVEKMMYALPLVQFDGYQFSPVNTSSLELPDQSWVKFLELNDQDQFVGYYNLDTINTFFTFDLTTLRSTLFPFTQFIPKDGIIRSIFKLDNGNWLFFIKSNDHFYLYEKLGDSLTQSLKIPYNFQSREVIDIYPSPVVSKGKHIWFMDYQLPLVRWNKTTGKWKKYDKPDFPVDLQLMTPYIKKPWSIPRPYIETFRSDLIACFPGYTQNYFFKLDTINDTFIPLKDLPTQWHPEGLFKDQSGNLIYFFTNEKKGYEAILEDANGKRFNLSSVLDGKRDIKKITGKDFKKTLFICSSHGFYQTDVRQTSTIRHYLKNHPIRVMTQLPDNRYLVCADHKGWFTIDDQTGVVQPFNAPSCEPEPFHGQLRRKVTVRPDSTIWTYRANKIYQYAPSSNSCQSFEVKNDIHDFVFLNEDSIAYWNARSKTLDFLDLKNKELSTYEENGNPLHIYSFIQAIQLSHDGQVLLTTNTGLWKIDYKKQKSQIIGYEPGFTDYRFITAYEEPNGRLWLGTYMGGLQIYDPNTKKVKVLDQGKGLTNNTVVGILPDEEGDFWISTYNGISIVSPEGEIITNIRPTEGLIGKEFNRYAYTKGREGAILLGTTEGLNVIDAIPFKTKFITTETPKIYLTEISFFDKEKGTEYTYHTSDRPEVIDLQAEKRYLYVKFALSSYIGTDKNKYAYKIEGINNDWIYIGTQRELSLTNLPAGKYTLKIKGANHNGIWSPKPISLSIHVREFFHKQSLFYVLIFLGISLVALFWIWRLRSEKIRLETEVRIRTEQIRQDKEQIENQAKELQQLDEVKSRFFTNISHELRTPVTLISTPVEQILRKYSKDFSTEVKKSLQTVHNNSRKLLTLVEELLELSRIDAGKQQLSQTPTHLYSFCRQLFSAYESTAQIKHIDYWFHYQPDESLHFLIDKKRLEKIINNLLSNALKFTPSGGKITFSINNTLGDLKSPRVLLILKVKDTGRGIPPEDLPHVFDRYFQTKRKSIPKEGGTGIGLALARELAELMQGRLEVESEWQKGSTFTLRFSATKVESPIRVIPSEPGLAVPQEKYAFKANASRDSKLEKVLIVEDNLDMQQLLRSLLSDQYHCIMTGNGAEAWDLLKENDPKIKDISLILSDIMMPQMDGYELLELIKSHTHWQKVPVIMLTARAAEDDKLQALRMGVDDYLIKPFSPKELLARMTNLINNYQTRQSFLVANPDVINLDLETKDSANQRWLKKLEEILLEALDKKLEITTLQIADEMAISSRQMLRRIKALTGLSIKKYIQEVKLQKARHMLEHREVNTISEVAYACGFNTPGYFTQVFEARFGKRPGDYLHLSTPA